MFQNFVGVHFSKKKKKIYQLSLYVITISVLHSPTSDIHLFLLYDVISKLQTKIPNTNSIGLPESTRRIFILLSFNT